MTISEGRLTIDQCVENVLAVLLHQVVDVTKDTAEHIVSHLLSPWSAAVGKAGQLDLPHGDETRDVWWM
jgi:hypothetical protein